MKNILMTSILAIDGIVVSTQSAQAGNSAVSLGDNDLLLGFHTATNPGLTTNLELNLGNADAYYNPNGDGLLTGPSIVNIGRLSVTDLIATYGSGWAARTNLSWGIVGTSSASGSFDGLFGQNTIYLSRAETGAGVQTTPWNRQTNFAAANTQISSLGGSGGYVGTLTSTSDYDLGVTAANANSYQTRSAGQPGQTFAAVNGSFQNDSIVDNFSSGNWISVQDVYALQQGATTAGTYIGSFGLRSNGTVDYGASASFFAPTAVPEPGTAVYGLALFVASALRCRRNHQEVTA